MKRLPPGRLLLPLGLAVCLSLFGDLTLYAVLATERAAAGLSLGAVGMMLAANRLIRIPGNPVIGTLCDALGRRRLFVLGMLFGTLSTAAYGCVRGVFPFLLARLLWGIAWMCINVGGMAMVLDISTSANRGQLMGSLNAWTLLGFALGPLLGGFLVDAIGFRPAMLACAGCTAIGLLVAVVGLPETSHQQTAFPSLRVLSTLWREGARIFATHPQLLTMSLLYLLILFAGEGLALSTLNLWLERHLGNTVSVGHYVLGIAAVSGGLTGARALIAGVAGPLAGRASDVIHARSQVIAVSMIVSALGLIVLSLSGSPWSIVLAIFLSAFGDGATRSTLTAAVGDAAPAGSAGLVMGMYATVGDVGSTLGPILAFGLLPYVDLRWLYMLSALAFISGLAFIWRFQKAAPSMGE
ncbi:MAG: MFS transporter [Anaerolineae bacterium]|nr:MFS transporter [Anaerolineae bacterium]